MDLTTPIPSNGETPVILPEKNTCSYCFKEDAAGNAFCLSCGYPLKGTEQEKNNFIAEISARKIDLEEAEKNVSSVRNYLYILAGITGIYAIIAFAGQNDVALTIGNIILGGIYTGLALWSKNKPFAAILTATIIYLTVHLLNAFVDPATILQGIIFKIIIIGLLIKGIRSGLEAEKLRKRLQVHE